MTATAAQIEAVGNGPTTCRICDGTVSEHVWESDQFRIKICKQCGVYAVAGRPTGADLLKLYNGDALIATGQFSGEPTDKAIPTWKVAEHTFLLDRVGRIGSNSGALLDVGCFSGAFLTNAKERGYAVAGVEPNRDAYVYVRDNLGFEVRHGSIESAGFSAGRFSVVSYLDVIEHVAEPVEELEKAYELLRPSGVLVITTPNVEGLPQGVMKFKRALMRQPWCPIDEVPWHLWGFTRRSLRRCVENAGFAVSGFAWLNPSPLTTNHGAGSSRAKRLALLATGWVSKWLRMSDRMALFSVKPG